MKEQRKLILWIKEHRKQLIIAGIGIGAFILVVLGLKNRESIKALWGLLKSIGEQPTIHVAKIVPTEETAKPVIKNVVEDMVKHREVIPHDVVKHVRNLPLGQRASEKKIATALENGFELAEGQTWVIDYATGVAA